MQNIKSILSGITVAIAGLLIAAPAFAAYTVFTGNDGNFVVNSATPAYLAAQGTPTEFLSFNTGKANATVSGNPINGAIFSNNVTFSSGNNPLISFNGAGPDSEIGPANGWDGTLSIVFNNGFLAQYVGFGLVDPVSTIVVYDQNNVATTYTNPNASTFDFFGLAGTNGSEISRIDITDSFFAIQDFQYAGTAVPEPGTMALMMAGLLCAGFWMRRRAK